MTEPDADVAGIFPSQTLRSLIACGVIVGNPPEELIQPASLDLRLGAFAWRVNASFLPGPDVAVDIKVRDFEMHRIDLTGGAVLEKGCVYVAPLLESLRLPDGVSAFANPKSSTGRLDVLTRVISDRGAHFDLIPGGYEGPLYVEISPRTFSVLARTGSRLTQLRLRRDGGSGEPAEESRPPLPDLPGMPQDGNLGLRVDLAKAGDVVGWRARRHAGVVDVDRRGVYDPADFWEPVTVRRGGLVLNPDDFHILATREAVVVPPEFAAEMVAYDTLLGEFRVHYAGFFDPGFGWNPDGSGDGSRGVLEVRSHDVPFLLEHGQLIGRLRYERMAARPDSVYGRGIGSHYQGQALKLAKQFAEPGGRAR